MFQASYHVQGHLKVTLDFQLVKNVHYCSNFSSGYVQHFPDSKLNHSRIFVKVILQTGCYKPRLNLRITTSLLL